MSRVLFLAAGFLFLLLGLIGVLLPVLPTTPFLLLTAGCFAKGSDRFHAWFAGTWLYRRYLASYAQTRSMSRRAKLRILIPVTLLLLGIMLLTNHLALRIVIVLAMVAKYYVFCFRIPTSDAKPKAPPLPEEAP